MSRIRTFIALPIDRSIRDQLISLQERLAGTGVDVHWVEPENLHITLLFLGEVNERELMPVCKAVKNGCLEIPAFPMSVVGAGCFPSVRRPRVLWAGVGEGSQELRTLHDVLEGPLLDLGCARREDRNYTPHITLGRVKSDASHEELVAQLEKLRKWNGGQMQAKEVQVMSSELKSKGPEYAVLSRAKLSEEQI